MGDEVRGAETRLELAMRERAKIEANPSATESERVEAGLQVASAQEALQYARASRSVDHQVGDGLSW